ncbi:3416_t:CDS:1, partial [Acaulospora colombiana]
ITGGFAPPNPTSVQTFTSSLSDGNASILFQQTKRAHDQKRLPDEPTAQATLPTSSHTKVDELISELEGILKKLPTENPPGSKDIYGEDIGLMYGSDNVEWINGGPAGCGEGQSSVEATEEDKKNFKRAIAIVEELAKLGQVDVA